MTDVHGFASYCYIVQALMNVHYAILEVPTEIYKTFEEVERV